MDWSNQKPFTADFYNQLTFVNLSSEETPISAGNLNTMQSRIASSIDKMLIQLKKDFSLDNSSDMSIVDTDSATDYTLRLLSRKATNIPFDNTTTSNPSGMIWVLSPTNEYGTQNYPIKQIAFDNTTGNLWTRLKKSSSASWTDWVQFTDARETLWEGTLLGGNSIELDCSDYSELDVYYELKGVCGKFTIDLNHATLTANGTSEIMPAGSYSGNAWGTAAHTTNDTGFYNICCFVNSSKDTFSAYMDGSAGLKNNNDIYFVYKIIGRR